MSRQFAVKHASAEPSFENGWAGLLNLRTAATPANLFMPDVQPDLAKAEASGIPALPDCLNPSPSSTEGGDDGCVPRKTVADAAASTVDTSDMLQFMIDQRLPCSGKFHTNHDGSFTPIDYIFTSDAKACLIIQGDPGNIYLSASLVSADTALAHDDANPDNVFKDVLTDSPEITVDLFGPSPPVIPCSAKSYAKMARHFDRYVRDSSHNEFFDVLEEIQPSLIDHITDAAPLITLLSLPKLPDLSDFKEMVTDHLEARPPPPRRSTRRKTPRAASSISNAQRSKFTQQMLSILVLAAAATFNPAMAGSALAAVAAAATVNAANTDKKSRQLKPATALKVSRSDLQPPHRTARAFGSIFS